VYILFSFFISQVVKFYRIVTILVEKNSRISASMISSFTTESLKEEVGSGSGWSWISEPVGISKDDSFSKFGLLEQINTIADKSDYLWYSLRYRICL